MMQSLVLNANYQPLGTQNGLRKIIKLYLKAKEDGRAIVLEYYDREVHFENDSFFVPAVFHYVKYVNISPKSTPSKSSVLKRDGMKCQYCLQPLSNNGATIDHVKPVSFFKKKSYANTWDNMVACCHPCNSIKANRTPEQAGMKLKCVPGKPYCMVTPHPDNTPQEWKKYL